MTKNEELKEGCSTGDDNLKGWGRGIDKMRKNILTVLMESEVWNKKGRNEQI